APGLEVLVGGAAHFRERAIPSIAEPGHGTARHLVEAGLPRLLALIDIRLQRLEIQERERSAWMRENMGLCNATRDNGNLRLICANDGCVRGSSGNGGCGRGASGGGGRF